MIVGNSEFRFEARPAGIAPPEERGRQEPGEIKDEAGVLQLTDSEKDYWKVVQRIVDPETGVPKTRYGYYVRGTDGESDNSEDGWSWAQNGSVTVPTVVSRQLDALVAAKGIKQD